MNLGFGETLTVFFVIVFLIFGVGLVSRVALHYSNRTEKTNITPLEALKMRYARGEIDKEQFEQIKKDLA